MAFNPPQPVSPAPPPPPPGGGNNPPSPTGGLKTDLQTLIHDFLAHADATQLRADLTAVVTDIKTHNFGTGDPSSATVTAVNFIDTHPTIISGHS